MKLAGIGMGKGVMEGLQGNGKKDSQDMFKNKQRRDGRIVPTGQMANFAAKCFAGLMCPVQDVVVCVLVV